MLFGQSDDSCRTFNPPGDITALADGVQDLFRKEWPRAVAADIGADDKRSLLSLLSKAIKDNISYIFRFAVDPIALGIPDYHTM